MAKKVAPGTSNGCTMDNAGVRRWYVLWLYDSGPEPWFPQATLCLMKELPEISIAVVPGVLNRYYDFATYRLTKLYNEYSDTHVPSTRGIWGPCECIFELCAAFLQLQRITVVRAVRRGGKPGSQTWQ